MKNIFVALRRQDEILELVRLGEMAMEGESRRLQNDDRIRKLYLEMDK